jgi:hypothetical protein
MNINDQLENFFEEFENQKNLKLILDFESMFDPAQTSSQFEIPEIKYKKTKSPIIEIDLKSKRKPVALKYQLFN